MLHTETIKGETFELLMTLMKDEKLSDFKLAGGTSLALYLGHRTGIDFITHNYPYVESPFTTKDGIRIYGIKDIAAMKLSVIADDGTRLKDFIDIACLSTKLSLSDMLKAYQQKYKNSNPIRPLKGLTFFRDINFKEPIQIIQGKYNWDKIEKRLHLMIKKENDIFRSFPLE